MVLALYERKKCSPGFNEKKPRKIRGMLIILIAEFIAV
jgi:hypothetical protein